MRSAAAPAGRVAGVEYPASSVVNGPMRLVNSSRANSSVSRSAMAYSVRTLAFFWVDAVEGPNDRLALAPTDGAAGLKLCAIAFDSGEAGECLTGYFAILVHRFNDRTDSESFEHCSGTFRAGRVGISVGNGRAGSPCNAAGPEVVTRARELLGPRARSVIKAGHPWLSPGRAGHCSVPPEKGRWRRSGHCMYLESGRRPGETLRRRAAGYWLTARTPR